MKINIFGELKWESFILYIKRARENVLCCAASVKESMIEREKMRVTAPPLFIYRGKMEKGRRKEWTEKAKACVCNLCICQAFKLNMERNGKRTTQIFVCWNALCFTSTNQNRLQWCWAREWVNEWVRERQHGYRGMKMYSHRNQKLIAKWKYQAKPKIVMRAWEQNGSN